MNKKKLFIFYICYKSKTRTLHQNLLRQGREKINIHKDSCKKTYSFFHSAVI